VAVGLANYQDFSLSPLRSSDLIRTSEQPETSPFYGYFMERLSAVFEDKEPSVVGISLNYLSQAIPTFSMIGLIKKLCPDARLVLGGGLVTSWLSNPGWRNPFDGLVDNMVAGPGEDPLLDILGLPTCLRVLSSLTARQAAATGAGAPSARRRPRVVSILPFQ